MPSVKRWALLAAAGAIAVISSSQAPVETSGRYLEVRHSAPAGANQQGSIDQTLLAWKVKQGSFQGIPLNDLAVIAVISTPQPATRNAPLLTNREPVGGHAVLYVDDRAEASQQAALVGMARALAGDAIGENADVQLRKVDVTIWMGCGSGYATLQVAEADRTSTAIEVVTRRPEEGDVAGDALPRPNPTAEASFCRQSFTVQYRFTGTGAESEPIHCVHADSPSSLQGAFFVRRSTERPQHSIAGSRGGSKRDRRLTAQRDRDRQ